MATSTKRMIAMLIMIDILVGMVIAFNAGIALEDAADDLTETIEEGRNVTSQYSGVFEDATPDTSSVITGGVFGNIIGSGSLIWKVMKSTLGWDQSTTNCNGEDCSINYIKWVTMGLAFVLFLFHVFVILEVYYVFANKKYD